MTMSDLPPEQPPPIPDPARPSVNARLMWQWLTEPTASLAERAHRQQAQLLAACLVVIIPLGAVMEAATIAISGPEYTGYRSTVVALIFLMAAYGLSRTRRYHWGAAISVIISSVAVFVSVFSSGNDLAPGFLDYLVVPLLIGSLFLTPPFLALLIAADIGALLIFPVFVPAVAYADLITGPVTFLILTSALFLVISWFRNRLEQDRRAELAAERKLLRTVIDNMPNFIYAKDAQSRFILNNLANAHAIGAASPEEVVGKTDFDFYPRELAAQYHADDQQVTQTGQPLINQEEQALDLAGNTRWVLTTKVPLRDEAGKVVGLVGIGHDITDRKQREAQLRESEIKYRTLVEQLPAITYLDAVDPTSPTGFVNLYVSPQFERLLGYSTAEYQADLSLWYRMIHPDDRARVVAEDSSHFATGRASTQEYRLIARDGRVLWWRDECVQRQEEASQRLLTQGILFDITELKQRQGELQVMVTVATSLRTALTRAELAPIILDQALDLLKVEGAALGMRDSLSGETLVELARGSWERHTGLRLPPGEGVVGEVIATGQPYLSDDVREDPRLPQAEIFTDLHTAACVPLITHEQVIGALVVGRGRGNTSALYSGLSQADLRLLTALADMAANALHRAALHEQTRRRAEQLATINAIGQALSETLELPQIYDRLARAIFRLLPDISTLFVALFDPDRSLLTAAYGEHDGERVPVSNLPPIPLEPPGRGTQSEAVHTRRPIMIADLQAHLESVQTNVAVGARQPGEPEERRVQSGLYVPMLAKDRVVGVVQVQSYTLNRFRPEDAELLGALANIAAIAIENAQLFGDAHRRLNQVESLREIDRAISNSTSLHLTINVILEEVVAQLEVDACSILLMKPITQALEYAHGRGFRTSALQHTRLRVGEGHAGRAAFERRTLQVPDLSQSQDFARSPLLSREGFIAYVGVPLIAKGQVKGVLEIFHRAPLHANEEWLNFLETLAGQAAIAIDNAELFDSLQRSNAELTLAYDATIEGWSRALDLRDKETEGHTQRVTEMTMRLARAMGLGEADLVHIRRGALLHDIGKMGVPDGILLKPGKLTDEEWEIMRKHPTYAYEMLLSITYLRPALDIPYCHHEKWDGTGYPRGLKREAIPLAARLFAVVDVWDALCSDRPYRPGWPAEKVREHIRSLAGTHFDPHIVEAFLRILDNP